MAGGVGAAVGVVSTIAGMGEQSRQRKVVSQQAAVNKYAQEVQYEQQKNEIAQQIEFTRQQRTAENMALSAQDLQSRQFLADSTQEQTKQLQQLEYQTAAQNITNDAALAQGKQQIKVGEYQNNEAYNQRLGQAAGKQSATADQVTQQQAQLSQLIAQGRTQEAAAFMMQAGGGQQDSRSSQVENNTIADSANRLQQLLNSDNLTAESLQQALYDKDIAAALKQAGVYDLALQSVGNQAQFDTNKTMNDLQGSLMGNAAQSNAVGNRLAKSTLDSSIALRDQQRNVESKFSDLGYQNQSANAGIRNAASSAANQAASASSSGSFFGTLANAASLGGSLFNAYSMINRPGSTPKNGLSAPVSANNTGSYGASQNMQDTRNGPQKYGPFDTREYK